MTLQERATTGFWRSALLGAIGGAFLAISAIYGAASTGFLPGTTDTHIREYLLAHPALLDEMAQRYQEQRVKEAEAEEKIRQKAVDRLGQRSFFDPKIAYVTGPEHAKATFVEFFDYNCPHCRNSVRAVQNFYNLHKDDTRFAFIEFPVLGPESSVAARAAIAARKQPDKYLAFHFAMMNEQEVVDDKILFADAAKVGLDVAKLRADMKDRSIDTQIAAAKALAKHAGINGTPEFIVDGVSHNGEVDDDLLKTMAQS